MAPRNEDDFTTIWRPFTPQDVALIHSALSGSGIRYFIVNENYARASLGIGDAVMELRVETGKAAEALELVSGMLGSGSKL